MLVQRGRVELGEGAYVENLGVRARAFGIQILRSARVVTDWGLLAPLVSYIARQRRSQLSWVLSGHGYFDLGDRVVTLGPGDLVVSDQRFHADEGYAGEPSEIVVADWEEDDVLGPAHRGPPRVGRASHRDIVAMRDLARAISEDRAAVRDPSLGARVVARVRSVLGLAPIFDSGRLSAPADVAPLYASLARVRERLHERPALSELADELGLSDRHARRAFDALDDALGVGTSGWREFLGDTRIARAQNLLSIEGLTLDRIATLSGFGSAIALCHAFSERGPTTPGDLGRAIRERWGRAPRLDGRAELRRARRTGP